MAPNWDVSLYTWQQLPRDRPRRRSARGPDDAGASNTEPLDVFHRRLPDVLENVNGMRTI